MVIFQGEIIFASINAPGSWHDARIARRLYQLLLESTPDGKYLVADTVFPCTAASIGKQICAPLKKNERLPTDPQE